MAQEPDPYEQLAAEVVGRYVGVKLRWWDTGMAPRQPDWTWTTPFGQAFLEVTRDADPSAEAQYSAFAKYGHSLEDPTLAHGWWVVVGPRFRVSEPHDVLPLLREAELAALDAISDRSGRGLDSSHPAAWVDGVFDNDSYTRLCELQNRLLGELGLMHVVEAWVNNSLRAGRVTFSHPSFGGFNPGAEVIVDWLEDFLVSRPSDIAKLVATDSAERHLYVYANALSDNLMFPLWISPEGLPTRDPVLPEGLTHIWVSGNTGNPRVLMYEPASGWTEIRPYGDPAGSNSN